MSKEPGTPHVGRDSVIGSVGGKVLLTIHFVSCSFMITLLRDANTSRSVIDCFDDLYELLGREDFEKLFPVILTDNEVSFPIPKESNLIPNRITHAAHESFIVMQGSRIRKVHSR